MSLKIGVIGAGSTYTPELIEGILTRLDQIPVSELVLMDIDEEKLAIVGGLAQRMVARAGSPLAVRLTTDRLEAIRGAAYVLTQIRVGRLAARRLDELIPRGLGYVGQETTGAGGFFKALRTIPVILDIAREMREYAPGAVLVNFTNPAGIITEAVLTHGKVPVVGLCNGPIGTIKAIARTLDSQGQDVAMRYFGLNHLSFAADISRRGRDVSAEVVEALAAEAGDGDGPILRGLSMVPSSYLQYFYRRPDLVAQQQAESKSRAERVMEIEEELLRLYQDPNLNEKPKILEQRGGAWYSTVATMVIAAMVGNTGEVHIVNTRNNGAIPDLPPDCAVEVQAMIDARGATAVTQGPLPLRVRGLVQQVKAYEQLTVEAAVTGDRETAIWALINNPLVGSYAAAAELFDRLHEAHREYLPAFQ
ncbi:MAG: 6-phospho-beta-glucosidase [Chloroflexota bacterium]